jgi:hypothetical protein
MQVTKKLLDLGTKVKLINQKLIKVTCYVLVK